MTMVLTGILMASFFVLMFRAIDSKTVDSFEPRLSDAYWIPPSYRAELPKAGVFTLDDLLSRTREKKERDELALRLLAPREELIQWVERAELAQCKGVGIENLACLEAAGIHSVSMLASERPEELHERMRQVCRGKRNLRPAKVDIWVKEAKKAKAQR